MNTARWQDYILALQFFCRVLQNSPDREFLRALLEGALLEDFRQWDCLRPCEGLDTTASIEALVTSYGGAGQGDPSQPSRAQPALNQRCLDQLCLDQLYLALHTDHLALFSGPEPKAAPWESVWREKDRLLFGQCTEAVTRTYLDWGIRIVKVGHEPEDHLGFELAFVCYLLQVMQENPEMTACSGQTSREALAAFLCDHVLLWAGDCLRTASEAATTPFYAHVSLLCLALVHNLKKDLHEDEDMNA